MTAGRPRIAIVDDDPSVCRALQRLVRSLDMDAEAFTSGEAYLRQACGEACSRADCLILDLQMPGMSGLDVQSRLAAFKIPIIFITAHDEANAREQALAKGAVAFLRKPFDDRLLIESLVAALPGEVPKPSDRSDP